MEDKRPGVTVTTSYLECAVQDLAGDAFGYTRLAPPGMCPGHFDVSPGMVRDLRASTLLLRFDFQASLDKKIRPLVGESFPIFGIRAPEGLCIPESYQSCLQETYEALAGVFPGRVEEFKSAREKALGSLSALEEECRQIMKSEDLLGAKVIASGHQAVFCRWLGLNVIASYSGGNASTPKELQEIIEKGKGSGVEYIIANLQEGRQQAEALSARLDAPVVTFSNFPQMSLGQMSFTQLVRDNLENLARGKSQK